MTEIIIKKNQNEDEYVGFSQSVQRYHRYDVYLDNLSGDKETDKRYYAEAWSRQLITLAGMDEDEYQELQNSLENHIAQKKISVKVLHEMLLDIAKIRRMESFIHIVLNLLLRICVIRWLYSPARNWMKQEGLPVRHTKTERMRIQYRLEKAYLTTKVICVEAQSLHLLLNPGRINHQMK